MPLNTDTLAALADAKEKIAALPARIAAESELAKEEKRKPYSIQPLTAIKAGDVVAAIKAIGDTIPESLAEIVKVQRASCAKHAPDTEVALLSDQLAAILEAAGANVQG